MYHSPVSTPSVSKPISTGRAAATTAAVAPRLSRRNRVIASSSAWTRWFSFMTQFCCNQTSRSGNPPQRVQGAQHQGRSDDHHQRREDENHQRQRKRDGPARCTFFEAGETVDAHLRGENLQGLGERGAELDRLVQR